MESILLQKQQDDTVKLVGYWSRSLNYFERRYDSTQREFLPIVQVLTLVRPYLEKNQFIIRTEHASRRWILNVLDRSGRFAQWRLCLFEFSFDKAYHASIKYQAADARFRLSTNRVDTTLLEDDLHLYAIVTLDSTDTFIYFIDTISDTTSPLDAIQVPSDTPYDTEDTTTRPTITRFAREQERKAYRRTMVSQMGNPNTKFHIGHHRLLIERSTIGGAIQTIVLRSFWQRILALINYSRRQDTQGNVEFMKNCNATSSDLMWRMTSTVQ